MSVKIISQQGDTVDLICHRHYGRTGGVTEQVLEANPGLASRGPTLSAGVEIELPDVAAKQEETTVKLWD